MARFAALGAPRPVEGGAGGDPVGPADALAGARGEFLFLRADGGPVWVEASARAVPHGDGQAVQVIVCDTTARQEAEGQRRELAELARRQEEQLEHSTRLAELGSMAAAISHELNQPLTGIRNYARNAFYMLEKGLGGAEEVKGNLRLISEQVDRAAKIINQMRELTRRADRTSAAIDVNSVIRESVEFLMPQMRLSEVAGDPVAGRRPASRVRRPDAPGPGVPQPAHQRAPGHGGAPERRLRIESRRDPAAAPARRRGDRRHGPRLLRGGGAPRCSSPSSPRARAATAWACPSRAPS